MPNQKSPGLPTWKSQCTKAFVLIFFLGLFLQNFNILRVDVETQPIICFLAAIVFFLLKNAPLKIDKSSFICLGLILYTIVLFFIHLAIDEYPVSLTDYFTYLFGPIVYILISKCRFFISSCVTFSKIYISLSFFLTCAYFFDMPLIMPFYHEISSFLFIRQYGLTDSVRGFAFFYAEPSYAAVGFGVLFVFIRISVLYNLLSYKQSRCYLFMLAVCILATKSIMGLLILFLLMVDLSLITKRWRAILIAGPFCYYSIPVLMNILSIYIPRVKEISHAFSSIDSGLSFSELLIAISLAEPSGSTRIIANGIGLLGLAIFPFFGAGAGNIKYFWRDVVDTFNLDFIQSHYGFSTAYINGYEIKAQTYLFNALFDFGAIFALIFCFILVINVNKFFVFCGFVKQFVPNRQLRGLLPLMFLILLFQGQISNLYLWFILSIMICLYNDRYLIKAIGEKSNDTN